MNDKDIEIRGEALVGLAKRRAKGISSIIIHELQRRSPILLVLDAAEEVGDPKVLSTLKKLYDRAVKKKERYSPDEINSCWMDDLERAIASYDFKS